MAWVKSVSVIVVLVLLAGCSSRVARSFTGECKWIPNGRVLSTGRPDTDLWCPEDENTESARIARQTEQAWQGQRGEALVAMQNAKFASGNNPLDGEYFVHLAEFKEATDKGYFVVVAPPIEIDGGVYGAGSKIAIYVRNGQRVVFAVNELWGDLDWGACSPQPVGPRGEENLWVACRQGFFEDVAHLEMAK